MVLSQLRLIEAIHRAGEGVGTVTGVMVEVLAVSHLRSSTNHLVKQCTLQEKVSIPLNCFYFISSSNTILAADQVVDLISCNAALHVAGDQILLLAWKSRRH